MWSPDCLCQILTISHNLAHKSIEEMLFEVFLHQSFTALTLNQDSKLLRFPSVCHGNLAHRDGY